MAVKEMTPCKGNVNTVQEFAFEEASAAADGFEFSVRKNADEAVVVAFQNTDTEAAHEVTLKAPEKGSYYAADADEEFTVAAGKHAFLRFESAKWADSTGTVRMTVDDVKLQAVVLC